jgi:hypothetical protein
VTIPDGTYLNHQHSTHFKDDGFYAKEPLMFFIVAEKCRAMNDGLVTCDDQGYWGGNSIDYLYKVESPTVAMVLGGLESTHDDLQRRDKDVFNMIPYNTEDASFEAEGEFNGTGTKAWDYIDIALWSAALSDYKIQSFVRNDEVIVTGKYAKVLVPVNDPKGTYNKKNSYQNWKDRKQKYYYPSNNVIAAFKTTHVFKDAVKNYRKYTKKRTKPAKKTKKSKNVMTSSNGDLTKKNVRELRAMLKQMGVKGYSKKRKQELIDMLRRHM